MVELAIVVRLVLLLVLAAATRCEVEEEADLCIEEATL